MAHELELTTTGAAFFGARQPAWHRLGTVLDQAPATCGEAMAAAKADWTVSLRRLTLVHQDAPVETHRAVVRDSDDRVLGVVGRGYKLVQNRNAFAFFEPMLADGRARFETAGVLRGGQVVWALARVGAPFAVGATDDLVASYLLFSNTHDGSRSVDVRYTPIRVVCANTLAQAVSGQGQAVKIRHYGDVRTKLAQAQRVLGVFQDWAAKTAEAYALIQRAQLTGKKVEAFLDALFPVPADASPWRKTTRTNVRCDIQRLLDGAGVGLDLPGVRGTAWAAFNAVCEYADFEKPARGEAADRSARLDRIGYGKGLQLKQRALAAALALALA